MRLRLALASAAAALLAACAPQKGQPLRVGMVPDAGATQVSTAEKAPLKAYLEKQLGRPVQLIIPTNYNATVEGLGNGSLDVAYLGGLTYVKAHARYGVAPLVQRELDQRFHSLMIARPGSGISGLNDLKGRTFCFGDINSTSGHLIPYLVMTRAGLQPDKDLKSSRYTGSHPATIQAVAAGVCDAGAVDETVYGAMIKGGNAAATGTKVFFTSQPFADYVWAARKDLDAKAQQGFADALLRLKPGQDDQVLKILRGEHYVRADDGEYVEVRNVARQLGLM